MSLSKKLLMGMRVGAAVQLFVGVALWTGNLHSLVNVHMIVGVVFVLPLLRSLAFQSRNDRLWDSRCSPLRGSSRRRLWDDATGHHAGRSALGRSRYAPRDRARVDADGGAAGRQPRASVASAGMIRDVTAMRHHWFGVA